MSATDKKKVVKKKAGEGKEKKAESKAEPQEINKSAHVIPSEEDSLDHKPKEIVGKDAEGKDLPLDKIDWTDRDQILTTFPAYTQVLLAAGKKNLGKNVAIDFFSMKAPLSANYLLKDSPLTLEQNKKAVLIGDTGTGKSTLFREIAAGNLKEFPKHLHVHHCQEIELNPFADTVLNTVVRAHSFRNSLLACKEHLEKAIAASTDADALAKLKDNLEFVQDKLNRIQSDTADQRAGAMLRVLGFDDFGQKKSTNDLSGGLRMRVALCAAFFAEPDLLLLDEPTNHLDFPSVLWLENRLRGLRTSFVMVCHDRHLLNSVCTSVISIEEKKLVYFPMSFDAYEKKREVLYKKKAEDVEKFLIKYRTVDMSSPLAKEKAEKKAWLEYWHARQMLLAGKFVFPDAKALPPIEGLGPDQIPLVDVKDVTFSYNIDTGIWIFKDPINVCITTGSRMGLMGPNGAGKSTLLKLICDKLNAVTGTITRHPTATVAYFAQHHVMDLDMNLTPIEYMIQQFPEVEKSGLLRAHLNKVGLVGDKAETRMKSLSAGLRSCVVFAKITYYCPHLLIMDEPTNFLDLESVDALIGATNKFKGALLLVSHNRTFLLKCAKDYISVVPGKFNIYGDLKTCERATYQFIEEMESGVKVSAQNLVQNNPSADAANSVRDAKAQTEANKANSIAGGFVISTAAAKPKPVAKPVVEAKDSLVGKKCNAVWAVDGKRYPCNILKDLPNGEIEVEYIGYNEKAAVKIKDVIFPKVVAAPAGKGAPAGAGAKGKKGP